MESEENGQWRHEWISLKTSRSKSHLALSPRCKSSSTKISKLIIFLFKLLHRRLATNDFLNKIDIRPDDLCTFCRDERESLIHIFWSCRKTNSFWKNFQDWLIKNLILRNSNWTEWSTIQGVIGRVISTESAEREADLKLRARLVIVIGLSGVQFRQ